MSRFFLALLGVLSLSARLGHAVEVTQDDRYVYEKYTWSEMSDDRQRDLMLHFYQRLENKLSELGIPTTWSEETEQKLLGDQQKFQQILKETQDRANSYARERDIRVGDLIPTGFIVGVGINGSGNYIVGIGGTALLTLVVVPLEVRRIDKITRETKDYYEAAWAIGGLAQGGVGLGGGGGAAGRGAIGIIWGPLPDPAALTGFAVGVAADIRAVAGLGFKAAAVANSTTNLHNLVAMATFDVGPQAGGEIHGSLFYFMSVEQVIRFASGSSATGSGHETIDATPAAPASSTPDNAAAADDTDAGAPASSP